MIDTLEHHYVQVNGIRMHYVRAGHGSELVVLLHGFPEFWYSWRYQIPALAEHFTVIAPDLRGYNETEKPRGGYEIRSLVQDIVDLIAALGFEKVHLVGHDWGGMIAWSLAIARPELLERLAVLNLPHPAVFTAALRGNWRQLLRSWYMAFFQLPWLPEAVMRLNQYVLLEQTMRGMAIEKSHFTDQDMHIFQQALARPGALTASLNYYRALPRGSQGLYKGTGMRVQLPTLLIWGENDTALGKELTYGTERYVPDLRIRYVPNCGHFVHEEQPELVNGYLLEFLAGRQ